jgi:hypothetical protein
MPPHHLSLIFMDGDETKNVVWIMNFLIVNWWISELLFGEFDF